jgi:Ulp1 family protease
MTGRRRSPIVVDLTSEHEDRDGDTVKAKSKVSKNRVIDLTTEENSNSSYADDDDSVLNVIAGNPITAYHQEILQTGAWLNDEIINSYLSIVSESAKGDVHALSSHFHTKFMRDGAQAMTRWMKDLRLGQRRLVFVPINLNGNHWAMVVYHGGAAPKVCLYDSMMGSRSRGHAILQKYAELFEGHQLGLHDKPKEPERIDKSQTQPKKAEANTAVGLAAYLMTKLSLSSSPPKEEPSPSSASQPRIAMEIPAGQPQQTDGSSCGVFVCKWAQVLAEKQPHAFSQANVSRFRRTILDALLTHRQPS